MKRISIFATIVALTLSLTACNSEPETIEGYWMSENGETISFNSDGKAIVDGISLDYSIYNENNLSIFFLGFAEEYRFDIEEDVLTLTDLSSNSIVTYYRDEEKQKEIKENCDKIAAEQAEYERIQQQLEAETQAQKDYEEYVHSKKSRLDSIDSKIAENEGWIIEVQNWIADIDSDLAEVYQSDDMIADKEIQHLRNYQNELYEDIAEIEQEITDLETEKEEIIKELKELGEY